jgi:hypothetical protein
VLFEVEAEEPERGKQAVERVDVRYDDQGFLNYCHGWGITVQDMKVCQKGAQSFQC